MKRFSELESFLKEKVKGFELKPLGTQLLEGELIKEIEDEVTSVRMNAQFRLTNVLID